MLEKPVPDFNLIAPVYDSLAQVVFGKAQRRAQACFLPEIPVGAHVLVVGGGSGWVLQELLKQSQPAYVVFLEASSQMLRQAGKRMAGHQENKTEIDFRLGTEATLLPHERFHVVLTPFVLDLFSSSQAFSMMDRLHHTLLPGGLWLHTDFQLSAFPLQQLWQKPLLWAMYRFFKTVSGISGKELPPVEAYFQKLGMVTQQEAMFYGHFIKAQVLRKSLAPPSELI